MSLYAPTFRWGAKEHTEISNEAQWERDYYDNCNSRERQVAGRRKAVT